jgi:hypothetical protein
MMWRVSNQEKVKLCLYSIMLSQVKFMQITPKKRAKITCSVKNISQAVVEINDVMACLHPFHNERR